MSDAPLTSMTGADPSIEASLATHGDVVPEPQPTSEPKPSPSVGRLHVVAVSFFNHAHKVFSTLAHVLAVGPVDEKTGQPTLSLAYPDPQASDRTLTGVKWYEGYKREVGVQHASHPDVKSGALSVAWAQPMSPRIEDLPPQIPAPEGNASRPYFERDVPKEVEKPSIEQNLAVQRGLAPAGSVIPPTINEPEPGTVNNASDTPGGAPEPLPGGTQGAAAPSGVLFPEPGVGPAPGLPGSHLGTGATPWRPSDPEDPSAVAKADALNSAAGPKEGE